GQMASGIAHEINNPLAILRGNLDLSQMRLEETGDLDLTQKKHLQDSIQTCQKAISRIHSIVKSLQSFAKSDDSDPPSSASVQEIVLNSITLCAARLKNAGIHLEIDDIPKELVIDCRAGQIARVLLALVSNSIDAIEKDGEKWVKIAVQDLGNSVTISVTDSGYGIPDAMRGKIMLPFFTTKGIGNGTGLGLSVAKGLIEGHQGNLRIDQKSKNTCFIVELPKSLPASATLPQVA
ncbi:MAG: HAMP domain-containing sensor histidine kinase, partial [Bdellovibrionota bacterium]